MSEELQLSRRGLLQMVGAIVTTVSFAARRPLFGSIGDSDEPIESEVVENEFGNVSGVRLERFLKRRGIKPAHLARESGYSRQFLLRLRLGRITPTRRCVAEIIRACRRLTREPVRASDLFVLTSADARAIERMQPPADRVTGGVSK
jgi:hypothetical protein